MRNFQQWRSFGRVKLAKPTREIVTDTEYPTRLDIIKYPSEQLRVVNEDVLTFDSNLKKFTRNLFSFMYKMNGIGLSAPQVGVNKRILVFNEFVLCPTTEIALINPKIVWKSPQLSTNLETCLSFPRVSGNVTRSRQVHVEYQDVNGISQYIEFHGNSAIIFQHEYDHLEGVLFIDHFDESDQLAAEERLNLLAKFYPTGSRSATEPIVA